MLEEDTNGILSEEVNNGYNESEKDKEVDNKVTDDVEGIKDDLVTI